MANAPEDEAAVLSLISDLHRRRRELGLSQAGLAELMNVSQATVSEFERATSYPYLWTVLRYARALGLVFTFQLSARDLATPPAPDDAGSRTSP